MVAPAAPFVPGLELAGILYEEAVMPILGAAYPGLRYAAARVGAGSEVLGFDTARSADHDWGPRLELFLTAGDVARHGGPIRELLAHRLPKRVRGWPTNFRRRSGDPRDPVGHMEPTDGPVDHRVRVWDVESWLVAHLGPRAAAWGDAGPAIGDWLALPQQKLAEVTGGAVFRDDRGDLSAVRRRLAWYPEQVWRYLMVCQWQRISQEEAFVGRCAETGDDLGSAVVAARLVRDLMRLCLLMERRFAPYGKWLGSAFARLGTAGRLAPSLRGALAATGYPERERHLCDAYEIVGRAHNALGLTEPVDPGRRPYHGRPFLVVHAERFARALLETVTDARLRALPLTGGVDQWADSTDLLGRQEVVRAAVDAIV
ncbi:DUF4037 domain-containing protein [Microbispora sp. RL4-1S]|uniref:DUF4037 domain-containing protein n=1 Tax=Microbispora oryzae TaxID=2806554 RepID=A0A940WQ77_9ACTN|nr:DUF4037 domain-containing protein [Microbispora oryzae]MBP2707942.1 DUF4037 domain-containing protein [Microbispora oryzae]